MPRYFFHVQDGQSSRDVDGIELSSSRSARVEATRFIGELLRDQSSSLCGEDTWSVEVTDANGLIMMTLHVLTNLAPAMRYAGSPRQTAQT